MSELRYSAWKKVRLGQLVKGFRGVSYHPEDLLAHESETSITLLRSTNIQNGSLVFDDVQFVPSWLVSPTQILKNGDIAVCMSNGSKALVGKSAQYHDENVTVFTVGAFCSIFKPIEIAEADFIFHLFRSQTYQHNVDLVLAGSAINNLKNSSIENIIFSVPTCGKLRQKIATILTSIDRTIEKTEALIAKYQQIKAGMMHDLFTRGVLPDGQLRPSLSMAPELYQETAIGWIPREWKVPTLEELLAPLPNNIRSGPFGSALLKHELVENGIPLLGIDNVHVERFEPEFRRFVNERKFKELAKYRVRPRDVVITIMGTVGRCCVIPDNLELGLSSKHLWTMTFDLEKVIPELICWQLNHSAWAKAWFRRAMQGGIMDAIQSSTLKTLHLPVPGINEQTLIYARYIKISEQIQHESSLLKKLRKQKQGLMQDLLTGKVPVQIEEPNIEVTA